MKKDEMLRIRLSALAKTGNTDARELRNRIVSTQYVSAAEEFNILRLLRNNGY